MPGEASLPQTSGLRHLDSGSLLCSKPPSPISPTNRLAGHNPTFLITPHFFFLSFIYLRERESLLIRKTKDGLDLRTMGSRPELKADI